MTGFLTEVLSNDGALRVTTDGHEPVGYVARWIVPGEPERWAALVGEDSGLAPTDNVTYNRVHGAVLGYGLYLEGWLLGTAPTQREALALLAAAL